jgi:hypothetical protein
MSADSYQYSFKNIRKNCKISLSITRKAPPSYAIAKIMDSVENSIKNIFLTEVANKFKKL